MDTSLLRRSVSGDGGCHLFVFSKCHAIYKLLFVRKAITCRVISHVYNNVIPSTINKNLLPKVIPVFRMRMRRCLFAFLLRGLYVGSILHYAKNISIRKQANLSFISIFIGPATCALPLKGKFSKTFFRLNKSCIVCMAVPCELCCFSPIMIQKIVFEFFDSVLLGHIHHEGACHIHFGSVSRPSRKAVRNSQTFRKHYVLPINVRTGVFSFFLVKCQTFFNISRFNFSCRVLVQVPCAHSVFCFIVLTIPILNA